MPKAKSAISAKGKDNFTIRPIAPIGTTSPATKAMSCQELFSSSITPRM